MSTSLLRSNAMRAVALVIGFAGLMGAQEAAPQDPTERLRAVLPADVADRVIARIEAARNKQLPAEALEQRALAFASRGVAPADIERAIGEHATRQEQARGYLESAIGQRANLEEVEAGAEAIRQGVDGAAVSELAKSSPSGRSLAVPLYVIGSLVERGLPADAALLRVQERLQARASDAELERLTGAEGRRPANAGPGMRPTGRPDGLPATGGRASVPTRPAMPTTPPTPTTPPRP